MYRHLLGDSSLRLPINHWVIKISMFLVLVCMAFAHVIQSIYMYIAPTNVYKISSFYIKKYVLHNEFFTKKTEKQRKSSHMIYHSETATKPVYPQE